jgi:flagellar hook-basal body complex protein FliE
MANINDALGAYANTVRNTMGNDAAKGAAGTGEGPSFGAVLQASIDSAVQAQEKSEQVSAKAIVGKADMTEVLQAVNNAELALNTVLAVRDRVVQAYQEVMRTPI